MKRIIRTVVLIALAGVIAGQAQQPPARKGGQGGGARGGVPGDVRASTRLTVRIRTLAGDARLLDWKLGIPSTAFQGLTFGEAVARVDPIGLSWIEGFDTQAVSPEIQKNLDYNLSPQEIAAARKKLREFNLQMTVYHVADLGRDDATRRKVFQFAKDMGAGIIISSPAPASLAAIDKLAAEFSVDLAIENRSRKETPAYWDPKGILSALQGRSSHIGVCADIGAWMQEGIKPMDALAQLKDKVKAVNLRDRTAAGPAGRDVTLGYGVAGIPQLFQQMYKLNMKPLFFTVNTTTSVRDNYTDLERSVDGFEETIRPVFGAFVNQLSKNTPIRGPEQLKPEEKEKIAAAIPKQAPAKPQKPRKLLIVDICVANMSHNTIPHGNYALDLMGKNTGAYQAILSNDLDNLKWPKIKEFDAIMLNDIVGINFPDPEVREGLLRFVREGGGLGGLHGTSYGARDWPEFMEMLGAGEGPHRVQPGTWKIDDPNSPLTKTFAGQPFTYTDEYYRWYETGYYAQFYSRAKAHVLISIDMDKSPGFNDGRPPNLRRDNDYAISWIKGYGKGRVFNCDLGHINDMFMQPKINDHILAAVQFLLGDLEADTTPSAELPEKK
jgi:sugar phosphate isomerase/epimerase/type 1 glutamine amidotransferase